MFCANRWNEADAVELSHEVFPPPRRVVPHLSLSEQVEKIWQLKPWSESSGQELCEYFDSRKITSRVGHVCYMS
eukprot:g77326.t1